MSFVSNETYKMTVKPPTQKETGSAFDATVIKPSARAGAHAAADGKDIDAAAFSGFTATSRTTPTGAWSRGGLLLLYHCPCGA